MNRPRRPRRTRVSHIDGAARAALGLFLCAPFVVCAAQARAADDDDEIIIIDDAAVPGTEGGAPSGASPGQASGQAADETIIIVPEGELSEQEDRGASGALGRLWDTWHVAADSDVFAWGQLVSPSDGLFRVLGNMWLESWLLPAQNLSVYANGFARAALDVAPDGGRFVPFADIYEAYVKINVDRAAVSLGRLVVPWGRTQAAALGDRVSASDLRRGPAFPDPVRQKQPQWGASVRTSLGSVGVEGIGLLAFEPPEGSLAASNQGGVRVARYQTALVRSPSRAGGLFAADNTRALQADYDAIGSATVAGRAWRRVGDVDVSGSVVFGHDPTPRLRLDRAAARAAAAEVFHGKRVAFDDPPPCEGAPTLSCVGGAGALSYDRTTSLSLDASWGLGVVILRAEAVAWPAAFGGRQAHLVDGDGLSSTRVSQYAGALAVEGALGDTIDGSIEVFDVAWEGVPGRRLLYGVELFGDEISDDRVVHRLAGAVRLGGTVFAERVSWRLQGEAGVLQRDVLASAEVRFRLPVFNLYVGGRTDAFFGLAGSPGWMRQDASLIGLFVGEGA